MTQWFQQEITAIAQTLGTDIQRGLSSPEATKRLAAVGPNELRAPHRASPWTILLEQFKNILVVILLVAVGL